MSTVTRRAAVLAALATAAGATLPAVAIAKEVAPTADVPPVPADFLGGVIRMIAGARALGSRPLSSGSP